MVVKLKQGVSGKEALMGVRNLAHFMHKITLFFINSRGLKPEQGAEPLAPSL